MTIKKYWASWAGLVISCFALVSTGFAKTGFEDRFENGLRDHWNPVKFEGQTEHKIIREGTNSFLRAIAQSSASGLGVKLDKLNPQGAVLSWRWRIDKIPPGGTDTVKKTFDHTARLYVAFHSLLGPPRTINYVWANEAATGKTFHHPSSGRARFIVLQKGNDRAGEWILEKRDILQDWKLLFGDDDPPPIVSVGFMTDSDGTASRVVGDYDDLLLSIP